MDDLKKYNIVSCSGASNTGKFADEVARQLASKGEANMICLAKIAIGDQALIQNVKSQNEKILVLDGCAFNCAKKILEREGITENIISINTTDFDIVKGETPYSDEKANEIIEYITNLDEIN
ncbi:MAG: putative zinc-binding protein [Candidatus Moranbacteria bacterium]|nr:putative zinc-binding protein [Candidatus Moranbacteria bacterium]